jgi:3'-phosphoadenosine 5'-phosphosulfate sulfotransferase (PAPS reductase)/FAD synthetase
MNDKLLVVAFGGGTNSTAMLCGFRERGIKPDLILFADTGGEVPETYEHVLEMDTQCRIWWGIGIETVRKNYQGEFEGLEGNCIRKKMLPSLAYGRKAC